MALFFHHYDLLDRLPAPGSAKDPYKQYRSSIPEGESGCWKVSRFTVEKDLTLLRLMRDGRGTPPGQYTRLLRGSTVVMSDTDAELDDHADFFRTVRDARRVLIHGLGLGVATLAALRSELVERVDVVEIDADLIALIAPHIVDGRLTIHHDDCRVKAWPKGLKWDVVWHDIWDSICGDNAQEMTALKKKFARRCKWQACWAERLARSLC